MIIKHIQTEYGEVETHAEIAHTDNGQVTIHIKSTLTAGSPAETLSHEHHTTVGAENGKDKVSSLSEADLQAAIQKHLDDKRNEAAQVLAGRAKTARVTGKLI